MTFEEKQELCGKALMIWVLSEKDNPVKSDKDLEEMFIVKMLRKKFEVFKIDIVLPDMLLMILDLCTESNPGVTQVILKELLEDIKKRKGPIPSGYVIDALDFSFCFPAQFPILSVPEIYNKYLEKWDGQKYTDENGYSRNSCDTIEWWKEVMEDDK